jgi:hypothetical protein
LWSRHIGIHPGRLAGFDILDLEIPAVGRHRDPLDTERRSRIAAIFSARFLTRDPPVAASVPSLLSRKVIVQLGIGQFDERSQRGPDL